MAITINGTANTVAGLAVGGLPDGTVDADTLASGTVGGATGIDFNDSVKARFGTDDDLEIYHDNVQGRIVNGGTGGICLQGGVVNVYNTGSTETMAVFTADGAVDLYHNNSKKFETSATGINVNGKPTYSCRAWAKIDGDAGTLAFHGEEGFSSITDSGTGDYRLQLDDDFGDTNGSVVTSPRVASTSAQQWYLVFAHFQESDKIDIGGRLVDNDAASFAISDVDPVQIACFK